jgi:hypothetical protein
MEAQADWALDRKIRTLLNGLDYKAWSKGGMMAVMPYQLSFK